MNQPWAIKNQPFHGWHLMNRGTVLLSGHGWTNVEKVCATVVV